MTKVTIRKATHESGYLLSVTRSNDKGGAVIWPGPKCSSLRAAKAVAQWIEDNLV